MDADNAQPQEAIEPLAAAAGGQPVYPLENLGEDVADLLFRLAAVEIALDTMSPGIIDRARAEAEKQLDELAADVKRGG